jgi:hypothetical protein
MEKPAEREVGWYFATLAGMRKPYPTDLSDTEWKYDEQRLREVVCSISERLSDNGVKQRCERGFGRYTEAKIGERVPYGRVRDFSDSFSLGMLDRYALC